MSRSNRAWWRAIFSAAPIALSISCFSSSPIYNECKQSIDAYCASNTCEGALDWSSVPCNALPTYAGFCDSDYNDHIVSLTTFVTQYWYYDAKTGRLVAVVTETEQETLSGGPPEVTTCVAGPPDFTPPASCASGRMPLRCDGGGTADGGSSRD